MQESQGYDLMSHFRAYSMDSDNNSSNSSGGECPSKEQINFISLCVLIGQFVASLVILVILSFTQKRRRLGPNCLWGVPGLPVPVDFLVTPRYRTVYTVIFGVMATSILQVFQTSNIPDGFNNLYDKLFYKILLQPLILVAMLSLIYFPLFACVRAPRPWLGRILGLLYSILWFMGLFSSLVMKYGFLICNDTELVDILVDVAMNIPVVVAALIVVGWYMYKVVWGAVQLCRGSLALRGEEEMTESAETLFTTRNGQYQQLATARGRVTLGVKRYHLTHVKTLLKKPEPPVERTRLKEVVKKVKNYFFPYHSGFRFPLPFMGALVAMAMLLYQLTIRIVILGVSLTTILPSFYKETLEPLLSNLSILTNDSIYINELTQVSEIVYIGLPVLLCISPVLSFLLCLFLLVHMVGSVSKECKMLAKTGFKVPLPSPASRVPSAWKYIGYQIGFFVLAYSVYTVLMLVAGVVASGLYMGFRFFPDFTTLLLLSLIVPVGWSQLIFLAQSIVCRLVFFVDKKGKFIALTNTRLFNWFSFLLFFYNGFAGFVNAILRTLLASLFTILLLFRLDRVVLMRGFERFDFGHKAYLGFMYLDYTYNNAVVHVFIGLLKCSLGKRLRASARSILSQEEGEGEGRTVSCNGVQARNRWLVAYTLIRNPSLVKLTASNLVTRAAMDTSYEELELPSFATNTTVQRSDNDDEHEATA
ncbi:stimulated by retinoic acid gene 6 protein-like [Halichondria panicea]|uniref:stimulated by retinoic acid gene 6 protein-like n=1 Tax=Halichondria panicea TaxID=6063 RepID=UPI00312B3EFF